MQAIHSSGPDLMDFGSREVKKRNYEEALSTSCPPLSYRNKWERKHQKIQGVYGRVQEGSNDTSVTPQVVAPLPQVPEEAWIIDLDIIPKKIPKPTTSPSVTKKSPEFQDDLPIFEGGNEQDLRVGETKSASKKECRKTTKTRFSRLRKLGDKSDEIKESSKQSEKLKEQNAFLVDLLSKTNLEKAKRYLKSNKIEKAKDELNLILKIQRNAEAYKILGLIYLREGDFEAAFESFNKILEMPGNLKIKYNIAATLFKKEKYGESIKFLNHLLGISEDLSRVARWKVLLKLGACYFQLENYIEATAFINEAEKLYTTDMGRNILLAILERTENEL